MIKQSGPPCGSIVSVDAYVHAQNWLRYVRASLRKAKQDLGSERNKPLIFVLLATFGLSLKGIWARLAYAEGASVETVLFYRAAFSLPLVLLCGYVFSADRRFSATPLALRVATPPKLRHLAMGVLMGAFFSACMFCDFQSIYYLGAGVSRVVLFGYPLVVLLLDALGQGRLPRRARLVGFFVAWAGLILVCGLLDRPAGVRSAAVPPQLGWGLASLVLYAIYVFLSGKLSQTLGASRLSTWSNLTTSIVVIVALLVKGAGRAPHIALDAGLWVLAMVLVSTVIPYFLMMEGISRLGAAPASLISMVGPVMTLFAGALILGEKFVWSQIVGVVLTVSGVLLVQARSSRGSPALNKQV